jgi:predicted regulator of Ras-like GTPase activity (Roadblock/LC7/MglB family)
MAKIDLSPLREADGFMCAALVDGESGMLMAATEGGNLDLEVAAAGNTEVVRAKRRVAERLGIVGGIEDILITLQDQYHLIRPLAATQDVFIYLVLNRKQANLAMARRVLQTFEGNITL